MSRFIIFISFIVSFQLMEDRLIGNWNVIEEDGNVPEPSLSITFNKDHTLSVSRGSESENIRWRLIKGKKSNLLMIGEDVYGIEFSSDTLFLISESLELVLLKPDK